RSGDAQSEGQFFRRINPAPEPPHKNRHNHGHPAASAARHPAPPNPTRHHPAKSPALPALRSNPQQEPVSLHPDQQQHPQLARTPPAPANRSNTPAAHLVPTASRRP